ncbi:MAG TPA: DUF1294 domain-containing protein [Lachnospiraceae bacterium]|jgi:uncharacterized membrane protein YsdA (DUF1294 family)|nr:DUF1294 domain-containing protein [Lachnospiraceae bacterium]HCM11624.1 DUF1294 domain-containing protein [Lachnospiraceae bacterium]HCR39289.1 DUF1294 domain-containing protein [Lachnospiraceae bacterium]
MKDISIIAVGYLVILSFAGLISMGMDKRRAIRNRWRIPERTLLLIAFLGGGIGSFLGMRIFRHKTKHRKFVILLPIAAVLYAILLIYLIYI